eukprot:1840444-Amphidinium_carterae.1
MLVTTPPTEKSDWKTPQQNQNSYWSNNPQWNQQPNYQVKDKNAGGYGYQRSKIGLQRIRRLLPRARNPCETPEAEYEIDAVCNSMYHMRNFSVPELPPWALDVMYDVPTGVFPWKWPEPEVEESHDSYRDAINVALIMDDIDNQCEVPHEELYKYNPRHHAQTAVKQTQEIMQKLEKSNARVNAALQSLHSQETQKSSGSSSSDDKTPIRDLLDLAFAAATEAEKPLPTPVPAVSSQPIVKSPPPNVGPKQDVTETPQALPLVPTPAHLESCAAAAAK